MREQCLHSLCVCVSLDFLMQQSIVHRSKYFNSRTKTFRFGTIFFRKFAKNFGFPLKILFQVVHIE